MPQSPTSNSKRTPIIRLVEAILFDHSKAKILIGYCLLLAPCLGALWLASGIDGAAQFLSSTAMFFVIWTAAAVYFLPNVLLMHWIAMLEIVKYEASPDQIEGCRTRAERHKRLIKRLSQTLILSVMLIEVGGEIPNFDYVQAITLKFPIVWMCAAIAILLLLILYVGEQVEFARLTNLPFYREQFLRELGDVKLYVHQVPALVEQAVFPMMLAGVATGLCFLKYLQG